MWSKQLLFVVSLVCFVTAFCCVTFLDFVAEFGSPAYVYCAMLVLLLSNVALRFTQPAKDTNPFRAGLPVSEDLFFGRKSLIEKIASDIENHSILLTGERRSGKTSVLHAMHRVLTGRSDNFKYVPCYVSLESVSESRFFFVLATKLADEIEPSLTPDHGLQCRAKANDPASYEIHEFARDVLRIVTAVEKESGKKVKVVFLIDEVDAMNRYDVQTAQNLRGVLMGEKLGEKLRFVMAGRSLVNRETVFSPVFNYLRRLEIPLLEDKDAKLLMMSPVRGLYGFDHSAQEAVIRLSRGRPFLLQTFCYRLIERAKATRKHRISISDVKAVSDQVCEDIRKALSPDSEIAAEWLAGFENETSA